MKINKKQRESRNKMDRHRPDIVITKQKAGKTKRQRHSQYGVALAYHNNADREYFVIF